ncbi:probable carboxylesterase 18 [Cornus florida]|uniref:probable carboxylesterase 18 n=1 Tax=Cornus florida TaxID=4283 RepID=UPI00289ADB56|nr:probable carboxylesterase 18 [Cornus florida]
MEVAAVPGTSPSLPLKTRITLAVISTVTDVSRRSDGTINRSLLRFLDIRAPPNSKPIKGVKTSDVTVDSSRNLWFRVFVPTQPPPSGDPLPVIVFFHGGGFTYLSPDAKAYDAVCRRFASKIPAVVVSVNYRLAPEHRYPSQYDDGFDVLKFLDDNEKKSEAALPGNADISRCFLAGDSAGGNIAHHVAKRACESKFRKLKVIGLTAIQPFFGGEERTESERVIGSSGYLVSPERTDWLWKVFLQAGEGDRDHEAINVSGPRAADISVLTEFPATAVVVGGFDALKDWQRKYYHWLKASGKEAHLWEYPNMIHAFYIFPELPESDQLISQVRDFVHNKCSSMVDPS